VRSDLDLEIEQKNACIENDTLPAVKGYSRQLQQAFHNLVNNAMKYAQPGVAPLIRISCTKNKGAAFPVLLPPEMQQREFYAIRIKDNGFGFEPRDAERIFNIFTRLHGNAEYKGSGVGLSIVQKVMENHGGYVFASGQPGDGATFTLLIPTVPE
jgi:signal transduction histidine kinase